MISKFKNLLSIDGGGVRGIIAARILKEIETRMDLPASKIFDLASGTSTGSLIVIGAVIPDTNGKAKYSANDMVNLYLTESSKIFKNSVFHKIESLNGNLFAKYERDYLDEMLNKYFGETKISETLIPIIIPSLSMNTGSLVLWSTLAALKNSSCDAYLKDVAGASTATQTYFPEKKFTDFNNIIQRHTDGGLFLNNPQILPFNEIKKYTQQNNDNQLLMISIGTGDKENTPIKLLFDGTLGWIDDGKIINLMLDGQSENEDFTAAIIYPNRFRLQVDLTEKEFSNFDDASPKNLNHLLNLTEKYISDNNALFNNVISALRTNLDTHSTQDDIELNEFSKLVEDCFSSNYHCEIT